MAEEVRVVTADLREAARQHQRAAESLSKVPLSHESIQASLDSLGPIYSGLAEAGRLLLEERRRCYTDLSANHADLADHLAAAAAAWENHEQDAAAQFRTLVNKHQGEQ